MAYQSDFTQIASDFAAPLNPSSPTASDPAPADDDMTEGAVARGSSDEDAPSGDDADFPTVPDLSDPQGEASVSDPQQDLPQRGSANTIVPEAATVSATTNNADVVIAEGAAENPATAGPRMRGGIFRDFPSAPHQSGEFTLPLNELVIGRSSERRVYDFDSGSGESLLYAVVAPQNIAPIVVMKTGNAWHVIDGWARVQAFRAQFGNTANVLVRVIEWTGTREEEIYNRFAAAFLTLKSRKVDKSLLLRDFQLAWRVPQQVLAARIGWTESRTTRELAAAQAIIEAPRFAELHIKAEDPPIDYLYKVQQAREAAAKDDAAHPKRSPESRALAKLATKLETLLARPERFGTADALAKLGITKPGTVKASVKATGSQEAQTELPDAEIIDCLEDSHGEAIALVEMGSDQFPRVRLLIDTVAMDDRRKHEVRHLVHSAIDRLLGF